MKNVIYKIVRNTYVFLDSKITDIWRKKSAPVKRKLTNIRIKKHIKRILKKLENNEMINVLFLIQFPEIWNSEKTLYELLRDDERFDVKILTIPKIIEVRGFKKEIGLEYDSYQIFDGTDVEYCNSYENGKWKNISQFKYDYVFVQRPYSFQLLTRYSFYNLNKYGLLCHIPYGFQLSKDTHLRTNMNSEFINNIFYYFADTRVAYSYFENLTRDMPNKYAYNVGYPRFELFMEARQERKTNKKVFLWTPRWSYGMNNGDSTFLKYIEFLFDYFEGRNDCELIIRPHPLMFSFFKDNGYIDDNYVAKLKERIGNTDNITLDDEKDYIKSFAKSDFLISDFSSLLAEYYVTGKPIIYCGEYDDFNEIAETMASSFYAAHDEAEVLELMDRLMKGDDYKASERNKGIDFLINTNYLPSAQIRDLLLDIINL